MSCRNTPLPDGRMRQFDVTAAAVMAEGRRTTEVPVTIDDPAPAPAGSSRAREICISAGILVVIVGGLVTALVFFS